MTTTEEICGASNFRTSFTGGVLYPPFLIFPGESGFKRKIADLRKILNRAKRVFPYEILELRKDVSDLINYSDEM